MAQAPRAARHHLIHRTQGLGSHRSDVKAVGIIGAITRAMAPLRINQRLKEFRAGLLPRSRPFTTKPSASSVYAGAGYEGLQQDARRAGTIRSSCKSGANQVGTHLKWRRKDP